MCNLIQSTSKHKPPNNHSHLPNLDLSSLFLQKPQMTFVPGMPSVKKGKGSCKYYAENNTISLWQPELSELLLKPLISLPMSVIYNFLLHLYNHWQLCLPFDTFIGIERVQILDKQLKKKNHLLIIVMGNIKPRSWAMILRELVSAWHYLIPVHGLADATTTCFCLVLFDSSPWFSWCNHNLFLLGIIWFQSMV